MPPSSSDQSIAKGRPVILGMSGVEPQLDQESAMWSAWGIIYEQGPQLSILAEWEKTKKLNSSDFPCS